MNQLNRLLQGRKKGEPKPKGILSQLYQEILRDVGLTPVQLHRLMNRYLDDPANGINNDPIKRSYVRQNFVNALAGDDMTWKTFLKGMLLILPIDFEISIKARWKENVATVTKLRVNVRGKDEPSWLDECTDTTGLEDDNRPDNAIDEYKEYTDKDSAEITQEERDRLDAELDWEEDEP